MRLALRVKIPGLVTVFFAAALLLPLGRSADATQAVAPPPASPERVLRVAAFPDSYPYSYTDERGQLVGFSVDMTEALGRQMKARITLVTDEPTKLNERFQAGEFDFHEMLRETEERMAWADFSLPYIYADLAAFRRRDSRPLNRFGDLGDRRLVINRLNTNALLFVRTIVPAPEIVYAQSAPEALLMLEHGQADVALLGRLFGLTYIEKLRLTNVSLYTGATPHVEQRHGYAVRKGHQELLGEINEALARLYHTGEYDRIHAKWFGRFEPKSFTREEVVTTVAVTLALGLITAVWLALHERKLVRRIAEQKTALQRSEQIFRNLFNTTAVGMIRSKIDGSRILNVNDKLLEIFGWERPEVEGNHTMIHWADSRQREELVSRLKADQRVVNYECQLLTKQGRVRDCLVSLNLYASEGIMEGSLIDITDRKLAADAIRQQANFVRSVIDSNTAHLAVLNEAGTIVDVNEAWRRFARENGGTEESKCGIGASYFSSSVCANDQALAAAAYAGIRDVQQGARREFEFEYPCNSPVEQRWFRMRVVPLLGRPGSVVVSHKDETARRHAETALVESERRYRLVSENSSDVIWLLDLVSSRFTFVSPSVEKLLGFTVPEILGQTMQTTLTADSYAEFATKGLPARLVAFAQGEASARSQVHELDLLHQNGTVVPTEVVTTLIGTEGHAPTHLQGVTRDITLRRQAEADRLILSKLESTGILAAGIAHDFNNLLTSILLGLELIRTGSNLDDIAQANLRDVGRSVLSARNLTQQLITFAQGGSPVREWVDLGPLVRTSADLALSGSTVKVQYFLPPDLWATEVDPGQIGQVIRNLVLNAREAMPHGGLITVRAENIAAGDATHPPMLAGDLIRLCVIDQGHGIRPEVLPNIFDPYFSTKQRGTQKGMGLGLTISHAIVKQHRGCITVHSVPEQGTTFDVCLPATPHRPTPPVTIPDGGCDTPLPARVLLMDDEEMIRKSFGAALRHVHYDVTATADGREAIDAYRAAAAAGRPFDLVILDLTVRDGMGGLETIRHLHAIAPAVKAIVMSGYANDEVLQNFTRYGFVAALRKPFDFGTLQSLLAQLAGR